MILTIASGSPGSEAQTHHSEEVHRLLAAAKQKGERELDLSWSGTTLGGSDGAKKFEALFNRMYGTSIKVNFTPGVSMPEIAAKVAQELAAGQRAITDLIIGADDHYGALLRQKVLEEYDYAKLSPRMKGIVTYGNIGVEIADIIPCITYNSDHVPRVELPTKLGDVLNPKWKGKVASTQYAAFFPRIAYRPEWGVEKMKGFLAKLSAHVGGLLRVGEESRIVTGEFIMLALGDSRAARQAKAKGAPLGCVVPEDAATANFLHLGVPRNAAHPILAKLFMNMMVSEEGQRIVFDVYYTDHHMLPGSQSAAELKALRAKGVDLLRTGVQFGVEHPEMRELSAEFQKILREKR
jgi:ABC-type Fe3+ transport system substrate-binding protein